MVRWLAAAAAALTISATASAQSTLRMVLINDLSSLDPVVSTAAFVRNHGFLVYDQLFAFDSQGEARPQMVREYEASPDGMRYRFTLREGLAFHDGTPVRAADAVASIRRWGQRDVVGKALLAATASLAVEDDRTFTLTLARPFALVKEALARSTASALFVMPERIASLPANEQLTDATGSGPFVFVAGEWRAGDRAVYAKNVGYRPRGEPADGLAGDKVPLLDRIEWLSLPDPATAAAALDRGEIDFMEQPSPDLIAQLERNPQIKVAPINPVGYMVWLRIDHLHPPFNDARARQALLFLVNQQDVLNGIGIRPVDQVPYCPSYFLCGTPYETDAGAMGLKEEDIPRAQQLLKAAGYDGRPVVFLNATDNLINNAATLVMADAFKRAGLNMDVPSMDWGTLTQRRNRREPPAQGGWDMFVTVANVLDAETPLTNLYLASPCEGGLSGWPCDEELEALRRSWWEEPDRGKRRAILERVQERAYQVVPYINAGQFRTNAAWRTNVKGIRPTIIPVFWGVSKS